MHIKTTPPIKTIAYLLTFYLCSIMPNATAGEWPNSEKHFKTLPEYCRVKMQAGYSKANPHKLRHYKKVLKGIYKDVHHYCAAMHSFQHADGLISAKEPKKYWIGRVTDNIQYMENRISNKKHRFYAEMFLLKARTFLMQKQTGQAFLYFEKSLTVNPRYTPAYKEIIKYYRKLGDKKSALEVANRGLGHRPKSKSLLRIKSELTGG